MANALAMSSLLGSKSAVAARPAAFSGKARSTRVQARFVTVSAADRQVWFPGNAPAPHLDGSMPGDYGFDPLSLGSDPQILKWFQQAELVHARTAMTAVAGILFPAIATKAGVVNIPQWYDAGSVWVQNNPNFPFAALLFIQIILTGWVETKRWLDFRNPGSQGDGSFLGITDDFKPTGNGYPGGKLFDPFGLSRGSEAQLVKYQENEIKNGRLAMVAFLGFVAQHAATGKGPIDNLADHIANPTAVTFATNGVSLPFVH
ncbi:g4548 [Coccomyxa elongata]